MGKCKNKITVLWVTPCILVGVIRPWSRRFPRQKESYFFTQKILNKENLLVPQLNLILCTPRRRIRGVEVQLHTFFSLELDGC